MKVISENTKKKLAYYFKKIVIYLEDETSNKKGENNDWSLIAEKIVS